MVMVDLGNFMRRISYFDTTDDTGPILFWLITFTVIIVGGIVVIGALTSPVPSDLPFPLP